MNKVKPNSSEQLQKINPNQIQLFTMQGESHRGTIFNSLFRQIIRDLL